MKITVVAQRYIFGDMETYKACGTNSFRTGPEVSGTCPRDYCFVLLQNDCFDKLYLDSQLQLYDFQGALTGMDFGGYYKYNSFLYTSLVPLY
jgi:hypothetical protein